MRIQRPRISQPIITQPTITEVTSLEGDGANITGSFSGSFVGELTGPTSASFATRISASEASISTLDGSYATDAELTAASGALAGSITTVQTNLDSASGSLAGSITTVQSNLDTASGSLASDITSNSSSLAASITTVQSNLDTASGSLATDITTNSGNITSLQTYTGSLKTAISVSGANTTLLGNLTVQGTQTSLDTATLNVADLNILVASGAADAAAANGAGITVDGANATLLYGSSDNNWKFNKEVQAESGIKVTNVFEAGTDGDIFGSGDLSIGNITVTGTVDGVDVANLKTDFDTLNGKTLVSGSSIASSTQGEVALTTNGVVASAVDLGLQTSDNVQFNSIGIGTAGSGTTGEIRATGDITAYYSSDERLKENFTPLTGALDKVKAIGGYEFDWKDGIEDVVSKKGHDIGVKAQELQAQYPELVHERDNGYLAVDYIKLNAVLIEAVKELAAKVEELSK